MSLDEWLIDSDEHARNELARDYVAEFYSPLTQQQRLIRELAMNYRTALRALIALHEAARDRA